MRAVEVTKLDSKCLILLPLFITAFVSLYLFFSLNLIETMIFSSSLTLYMADIDNSSSDPARHFSGFCSISPF